MNEEDLKAVEAKRAPAHWYSMEELRDAGFPKPELIEKHLQMALEKGWAMRDTIVADLVAEVRKLNLQNDVLIDTMRGILLGLNQVPSDSPLGKIAVDLAGIVTNGLRNAGVMK